MKNPHITPTPDEKHQMISEAAYFRAEKRGFREGDAVEDWFAAEAEVEAALKESERQSPEFAAYERMRAEIKKLLANIQDTVSADTIKQTFEKANRELRELGEFVPETVDKAGKRLKQEIAATVEKIEPRWEAVTEKSTEIFAVWKGRGSDFLNQASRALSDWRSRYRSKNE